MSIFSKRTFPFMFKVQVEGHWHLPYKFWRLHEKWRLKQAFNCRGEYIDEWRGKKVFWINGSVTVLWLKLAGGLFFRREQPTQ